MAIQTPLVVFLDHPVPGLIRLMICRMIKAKANGLQSYIELYFSAWWPLRENASRLCERTLHCRMHGMTLSSFAIVTHGTYKTNPSYLSGERHFWDEVYNLDHTTFWEKRPYMGLKPEFEYTLFFCCHGVTLLFTVFSRSGTDGFRKSPKVQVIHIRFGYCCYCRDSDR
jgi:hypothetical protein